MTTKGLKANHNYNNKWVFKVKKCNKSLVSFMCEGYGINSLIFQYERPFHTQFDYLKISHMCASFMENLQKMSLEVQETSPDKCKCTKVRKICNRWNGYSFLIWIKWPKNLALPQDTTVKVCFPPTRQNENWRKCLGLESRYNLGEQNGVHLSPFLLVFPVSRVYRTAVSPPRKWLCRDSLFIVNNK